MTHTHDPDNPSCQCIDCRSRRRSQQLVADAVRPTTQTSQKREYQSTRTESNLTTVALVLFGVISVVAIISNFLEINLLQQVVDGARISESDANSNDRRQSIIGWLYLASFAISAITFLFWINRASHNLVGLGVENQQHSPGWAVGSWIIPILSLFRPYQVMKELWKGSYSSMRSESLETWTESPVSPLLGFWWGTWLVSGWVSWIAVRVFFSGESTPEEFIVGDWFAIASDAFGIVSAVMAIVLVRGITSHQDRKLTAYGHLVEKNSENKDI